MDENNVKKPMMMTFRRPGWDAVRAEGVSVNDDEKERENDDDDDSDNCVTMMSDDYEVRRCMRSAA